MSAPSSRSVSSDAAIDRLGHRVLMLAIAMATGASIVLGVHYGQPALALLAGLPMAGLALALWLMAPQVPVTRYVLGIVLMGFVALQIQLSRGMVEMHFGAFVTLAMLLVYRDWKVIVAAAASIAVHHVAFDRLQAAGWGVYCTQAADFGVVLVHAAYVVTQAAVEVMLAQGLRRIAAEGDELRTIIARIDRPEGLILEAAGRDASTEGARALQHALGRMAAVVRTVRDSARSVETASSEIAAGNDDLSRRTEQQASALQQTTSTVAQLTATVAGTTDAAQTANALAREASEVAERGGETMNQVVQQMGGISESSRRIAEITSLIDGIAFQTNILALNASVEAARAGEQGRGFAVVASEVRSLAQRSAAAAREIKDLITRSANQVQAGSQMVDQAGHTMEEIVGSIRKVSEMIASISSASQQQRAGFDQVGAAVRQIDQATQQNAALVEQSSAAASSLQAQAHQLVSAVSAFQVSDGT